MICKDILLITLFNKSELIFFTQLNAQVFLSNTNNSIYY